MKRRSTITQQDISTALLRFLNSGGVISKLPDQSFNGQHTIGEEKYEVYETIADLSNMARGHETLN